MISLPRGWPQFCRDLRQELEGIPNSIIPVQDGRKHHALDDARWVRSTYDWLQRVKRGEE